jgi:hypothetical protein
MIALKPLCITLAATIIAFVHGFTIPVKQQFSTRPPSRFQHKMVPFDASSILTAVEVFDGSSIVDPVVVSDVFWTSMQSKLVAVIIGQLLAAIVFAVLSSFLASQISQLGDFVSETIFSSSTTEAKPFIKANENKSSSFVKPSPDFAKLLVCLAIDVIGSSSELIPVLGELTDVIYAPIAATILRSLYGGSNILFGLEFAEEILPFTDILPLATLW